MIARATHSPNYGRRRPDAFRGPPVYLAGLDGDHAVLRTLACPERETRLPVGHDHRRALCRIDLFKAGAMSPEIWRGRYRHG